jgi:hypothetical protein
LLVDGEISAARAAVALGAGVAARSEHHVTYYLGPFVRDPAGTNSDA